MECRGAGAMKCGATDAVGAMKRAATEREAMECRGTGAMKRAATECEATEYVGTRAMKRAATDGMGAWGR
jgi:hypothetical protein